MVSNSHRVVRVVLQTEVGAEEGGNLSVGKYRGNLTTPELNLM